MSNLIPPRILKGFRDTLPNVGLARCAMMRSLEDVFASFGFAPIDTPALEYAEILLGKGSAETDKQLYRFKDNGDRDVALRFDLTVPLARFVAEHVNEIGVPFKRYHIAPVWRAEKPQRGRYREFVQCDFDIIGTDSVFADAEILTIANASMRALGIRHQIRVNNRRILNGLLEKLGAGGQKVAVMRGIDKLEKLGREVVVAELTEAGLSSDTIEAVFSFLAVSSAGSDEQIFSALRTALAGSENGLRGVEDLAATVQAVRAYGTGAEELKVDLAIARGLDYYTGTVFETALLDLPEIGSICSGGRYDDLASLYTKRRLPGVGGSVGLDRIFGALEALGRLSNRQSPAQALVTMLDESAAVHSFRIAAQFRAAGIPTEVFPEAAQLGGQLKYADRKGMRLAVIIGAREAQAQCCAIKDLSKAQQFDNIPFAQAAAKATEILQS